ncbi:MAG: hypothetical protein LBD12_07330 [Clostridiales Family XIII bacterium]|nr:hypothetical protein [Clostridiales Family XIII bacterium]
MQIKDIAGNRHKVTKRALAAAILVLILMLASAMYFGGCIAKNGKSVLSGILPRVEMPEMPEAPEARETPGQTEPTTSAAVSE